MPKKCYVDNAPNRSLGRVGMTHGTAVHSASPSPSSYVDNAQNRSFGRVGMTHGTAVHSASPSPSSYVDNAQNRSLGRVGMTHGTAVHSASPSPSSSGNSSFSSQSSSNVPKTYTTSIGTYVDQKLEHVDKPLVSCLPSSSTPSTSKPIDSSTSSSLAQLCTSKTISSDEVPKKCYVDNSYNRKLGRVGKPLGTHVVSKKLKVPSSGTLDDSGYDELLPYINPSDIEHSRLRQEHFEKKFQVDNILLKTDSSQSNGSIEYSDLSDLRLIGGGGFGEVYAGFWKQIPIAFKKLSYQSITRKKKESFMKEIKIFSMLDHPNIVKMFGAVVKELNLGIVMEYLRRTLFQALFCCEVMDLTKPDKKRIIGEVADALEFLHTYTPTIAHCDMKSQNILLDSKNVAKLCDFGLSVIKNTVQSSCSIANASPGQGTPRYSSPEVLRGELLNINQMMMSDMYSLSLVVYEVFIEEEPYEEFNIHQLREKVGRCDFRPPLDVYVPLADEVNELLTKCWDKNPEKRPNVSQFIDDWEKIRQVYITK